MSDERATAELSDAELSTVLRELAAQVETPPAVAGAEVRGRAVRRGRRRRATLTLGAGAAAVALTAFGLTLNQNQNQHQHQNSTAPPAAGKAQPAPAATPDAPSPRVPSATPITATIDLRKKWMIVDDRNMPITSGFVKASDPVTVMRVTRMWDLKLVADEDLFKGLYYAAYPYVIELRDERNNPVYLGALTYNEKVRKGGGSTSGWVGVSVKDAAWLFKRLRTGENAAVMTDEITVKPTEETPTTPLPATTAELAPPVEPGASGP